MKRQSYLQWYDSFVKCLRKHFGPQFERAFLEMKRDYPSIAYDGGWCPKDACMAFAAELRWHMMD